MRIRMQIECGSGYKSNADLKSKTLHAEMTWREKKAVANRNYLSQIGAYPGGMHRMHVHLPPPPQPERLVMRKDEAVSNKKKIIKIF
jgi:hypothetical protein